MKSSILAGVVALAGATACGASFPAPTQRMADAMSAERSAEEVGANSNPQAQLHIKLAQEQIAKAKGQMADGDNERAEYTLVRAKADAELALAIARAMNAKVELQKATDAATSLQNQNVQNTVNTNAAGHP